MSQQVTQNVSADVVILLSLDDVAVTGLADTDVTAQMRKAGAGSFSAKALTVSNFSEIGLGVYEITFDAADLDTLGTFTVVVDGAGIDQSTTIVEVLAATQATTAVSLQTCVITGHVFDLAGKPISGASVSARVVGLPSLEQDVAAVSSGLVASKTDSGGQYFLELIRLADVEVHIPLVNLRKRFVVPNSATANLLEIP